jgi:hypothetical protein
MLNTNVSSTCSTYPNYWGVHPVARVSSTVNKPLYATMFLVLVFIVHLHYMFRPLIGGHLQRLQHTRHNPHTTDSAERPIINKHILGSTKHPNNIHITTRKHST